MFKTLNPEDVKFIVVHCSATKPSMNVGRAEIEQWHRQRGMLAIGYHYVIRRDGKVEEGRAVTHQGAHVSGYNHRSIGVCWVGGVRENAAMSIQDNRTVEQKKSMALLITQLTAQFPSAKVVGHRDLSPDKNGDGIVTPNEWLKGCPSFDVRTWWQRARP